ncbi:MAG: 2-oxoglutarate dehydrogenase complex dihydrolipoyllysine-residue succinyltransferase [Flavobacteriales bacterium]
MSVEIKVPSPGESISEVEIAQWLVNDGDYVEKDQTVCELDSDKATLELTAEEAGVISIKVQEGESIAVGDVACTIDTSAEKPKEEKKKETAEKEAKPSEHKQPKEETEAPKETEKSPPKETEKTATTSEEKSHAKGHPSPAAKKMMEENDISPSQVEGNGKGGRILKQDVANAISGEHAKGWGGTREVKREKLSSLRKKLSERLVSVKNETAMLTTFNEVDMSYVKDLRDKYKESFKEKHGTSLGYMSFFTKAVCEALNLVPNVNSMIDGDELVSHNYADVGIAVSTPKGLMVPILRNAEQMSLAEIENEIKRLAKKARDGKISLDEMQGGTFTITNGGVFGSMLSTPIINPPQSAILGMHNIVDRPIAVNGNVEVRPVMYIALSYDHRIIDGKESVTFLYKIKEMIENPTQIIFGGKKPEEVLLDL